MLNSNNTESLRLSRIVQYDSALKLCLEKVKKILPGCSFNILHHAPGLYVQYFPADDKVYIGQSINIFKEVQKYKSPSTIQNIPYKKEYFDRSGVENVKGFSINLSDKLNLSDKNVRLSLEKNLIKLAGDRCINAVKGSTHTKVNYKDFNGMIEPVIKRRIGTWQEYKTNKYLKPLLPYKNLEPAVDKSCLYVIYHVGTGNFYIGQTSSFNVQRRMATHIAEIRKCQYWDLNNMQITGYKTYGRMITDMRTSGPNFLYSIIEQFEESTLTERIKRENFVIADAIYRFGLRVYNNPDKKVLDILKLFQKNVRMSNIDAGALKQRRQIKMVLPSRIFYPVVIEGKWFNQVKDAAAYFNLNPKTVSFRLISPSFPAWITLKDLKQKKLPDLPDIQSKAEAFYAQLGNYKT